MADFYTVKRNIVETTNWDTFEVRENSVTGVWLLDREENEEMFIPFDAFDGIFAAMQDFRNNGTSYLE